MILEVVNYGRPILRQKGARVIKLTPEIKQLIADMFETMHEHHGVGLAAQQIGKALQVTVIDVREANKDRPSTLELDGKPAEVDVIMPLVLINPEIKPNGEPIKGGEGCLSFPEIFAEIARPEFVDVKALDKNFKPIEFRAGGLLARAIQHEVDHLNGILFIDRMEKKTKEKLQDQLDALQTATKAEIQKK
ncbi:MAG TPA: peptide deformylase [Candidatus Acidoferrum sp.]|nr:peptide deformylase [Candidatus Acidoferrum sp.]